MSNSLFDLLSYVDSLPVDKYNISTLTAQGSYTLNLIETTKSKKTVKKYFISPDVSISIPKEIYPKNGAPNYTSNYLFITKLIKAIDHGWILKAIPKQTVIDITPPGDFECINWSHSPKRETTLLNLKFTYPEYFWDNDVLEVGCYGYVPMDIYP
jgi:hypothetical protein